MILQKISKLILTVTAITMLFSGPLFGKNLEIKQKNYTYPEKMTQAVTVKTFVITTPSTSQKSPQNFGSITAHFELNSADLLPLEKTRILSGLTKNQVSKNTPLVVTGYTCQRGSNKLNQTLSLGRAKAVANFLKTIGYLVASVKGEGAIPSSDSKEFYKNRRVEIKALKP